jgi:hypothetical protein
MLRHRKSPHGNSCDDRRGWSCLVPRVDRVDVGGAAVVVADIHGCFQGRLGVGVRRADRGDAVVGQDDGHVTPVRHCAGLDPILRSLLEHSRGHGLVVQSAGALAEAVYRCLARLATLASHLSVVAAVAAVVGAAVVVGATSR